MVLFHTSILYISLFLCGALLPGCSHNSAVRHIASETGLTIPNQTTQKEVLSYMGFPESKKTISENEEQWIYYQANESLMRRTPFFGHKMGQTDYDVAIINFQNQLVTSCQYRSFNEEEFKQLGIPNDAQPE